MPLDDLRAELASRADPGRAAALQRFFKTGPGEYGEGDVFLGVTVPDQRRVARRHRGLTLEELGELLASEVHEHRLTSLIVLVAKYREAPDAERELIAGLYLEHLDRVNNWDLVDASAHRILGEHLVGRPRDVLYELASSESVWRRRVAVIATFAFVERGEAGESLRLAELLLGDPHDLIHKAVGWMLREVGKRVDEAVLEAFLDAHAAAMPRTMLRYAIERLPEERRRRFLASRPDRRRSGGGRMESAKIGGSPAGQGT